LPVSADETLAAVCANVALRDLNLVDVLLAELEEMEAREEDGARLGALYRLDHLAARLRRNAENLRVLAGHEASDVVGTTLSVVDVVRGAMSSIDQYARVTIGRVVSLGVVGFAAEDVGRVVAELLDNAASSSPPSSVVRVSAHLTEQGSVLVRVEDEGIGLPPQRLAGLNERLAGAPVLDDESVRHMGLAVVRRLAARHGMRAWLDRRVPQGTTASVLLPASLVTELPEQTWSGAETVAFAQPATDPPRRRAPAPATPASVSGPSTASASTATAPAGSAGGGSAPVTGGRTASGLPKRVSHSLKEAAGMPSARRAPEHRDEREVALGRQRLLADLEAFSDGERAARNERPDGAAKNKRGDAAGDGGQSDGGGRDRRRDGAEGSGS
jgi:anti-sigma regulatory factor (Ser/Thr protein kinase)